MDQHANNPFMHTLQSMQQGGQKAPGGNPMAQMAVSQPAGSPPPGGQQGQPDIATLLAGMQGAGGGGGTGASKMPQPSNLPGGNPGSTASLVKALAALNQVITDTDDTDEIQIVRQIIMQIQHLINMDQQKQGGKESGLAQAQNQVPAAIQAPQGVPAGGPPQPGQ